MTRLVFFRLDRAIIFQRKALGLHKLPIRLRVRDYDLPPDLVLAINGTQALVERAACINIGGRAPDVNLTQHTPDQRFPVRDNLKAFDKRKAC
jgi:hypothetical protein